MGEICQEDKMERDLISAKFKCGQVIVQLPGWLDGVTSTEWSMSFRVIL